MLVILTTAFVLGLGLALSEAAARTLDIFFIDVEGGQATLVVTPAADLPRTAKVHGARLVIINRDPTPLNPLADAIFTTSIGEVLTSIDTALAAGKVR